EARCTPFVIGRDDEGTGVASRGLPPQIVQCAVSSGAEVILPIAGTDGAQAVMFLRPKLSELPFSHEDLSLLRTVATHTAVAFENALNYESVLQMKSHMESILMSLEDGLFTVSAAGQIGSLNDAAKRVLGLDGRHSSLAEYDETFKSHPDIRRLVQRALSGSFSKGEEIPYGGRTLSITTTQLSSARGEAAGVLVAFTDITENKRLTELVKRNERLAALGEMAAYVAHEIKNPITSMRLLATALPGRLDDERFLKTVADVIPSEVGRLDTIIRDLLEYARPAKLTRADLDLESVTKRSIQILRPEMEEQGIRLSENYSADRPTVMADGEKLKQVLVNVMKNAMEAVAESKEKAIRVGVVRRGEFLAVRVNDSGVGMAQEVQKKLFRPFFSTKRQGTGLGLAISQKIVEEHGGRIDVASSPGKGSTFTILLPAQS
ncbi:MAG: two-component system sensor histidine kinase NtrB, partial [Planctomycetota bacterium]